jgi:MFS-type transporter involved in bile tolerance (Atg22 family)
LPRLGRAAFARGEREGWKEARRSRRFGIRRVFTTAAAVIIGGSSTVLACPVCFGAEETAMIDGTKLGILVMLAITFAVQGGFVGFFLYLRRRAKRIAEVELDTEWSELQKASRTP